MKFTLSFAEYSAVNAMRRLDPRVTAMLMGARVGDNRTWVIEHAETADLQALLAGLATEAADSPSSSVAAVMLPRVAQKIEELLGPVVQTIHPRSSSDLLQLKRT